MTQVVEVQISNRRVPAETPEVGSHCGGRLPPVEKPAGNVGLLVPSGIEQGLRGDRVEGKLLRGALQPTPCRRKHQPPAVFALEQP